MSSPYPSAPRRFERSRTDRFLGGVCGGAAKYLNMDPTLVRVLTAVLAVFFGITVIAYIVLLFALPEEEAPRPPQMPPYPRNGQTSWTNGGSSDPVWGAGGAPWEQPQTQPRPQANKDDLR